MADNEDAHPSERSADGASANTTDSSVRTELTVSDYNLLELEALDDTPGVYGALNSLGYTGPPEGMLGICVNQRDLYRAAAATTQPNTQQPSTTWDDWDPNPSRRAPAKPKYVYAPTPESSEEALDIRKTLWRLQSDSRPGVNEIAHDTVTSMSPSSEQQLPVAEIPGPSGSPAQASAGPTDPMKDTVKELKEQNQQLETAKQLTEIRYRELETRFNDLTAKMDKATLEANGEISELKSQIRLKDFKLDRALLLVAEFEQNMQGSIAENGDMRRQIETMRQQMIDIQSELERDIGSVNTQLQMTSAKLQIYEQLENSVDTLIQSAAQVGENADISAVLEGPAPLLTDPRRRLIQTVELTTRVNELENTVKEQKEEIHQLYDQREALRRDLSAIRAATSKPISSFVKTITDKDMKINELSQKLSTMQKEYIAMKAAKEEVEKSMQTTVSAEQMLELYKASVSTSNTTESASRDDNRLVPERYAYRSLDGRSGEGVRSQSVPHVRFQGVEDSKLGEKKNENDKVRPSKSTSGRYISIQNHSNTRMATRSNTPTTMDNRSPSNQSVPTVMHNDDLRPVALHLSKVKPTKSTQF